MSRYCPGMRSVFYIRRMRFWSCGRLITIAALAAVWIRAWRNNRAWIVFISLSLLVYPHLFLVWHGDVMGTHRHALTVGVQFVLTIWFLCLLLAERMLDFLTKKQQRRGSA
jgi:hypothetical protein